LQKLQDHAPTVPFSTMQSVITEDLKMPFDQLFSSFEETPIAAASLAQVHRAVTKDGQKVAVKIQFPELLHQFDADMFVHLLVLKAGSVMFPGFDFEWMQDEVEGNLRKELNFVNEVSSFRLF
jgi:predicted unusual protein kinase regulating ubiquinone biosynthesis (AarF/ABC1/UbiB family)